MRRALAVWCLLLVSCGGSAHSAAPTVSRLTTTATSDPLPDEVAVWRRDNKATIETIRAAVSRFDAAIADPATSTLGMDGTCKMLEVKAKAALLGHRIPDHEIDLHWRRALVLFGDAGHVCSTGILHENAATFGRAQDGIRQGSAELAATGLLDQ